VLPEGSPPPRVRVLRYSADFVAEREVHGPAELARECAGGVLWVDVQGLGDQAVLAWIAAQFRLHALVLSDIVHIPQRPKCEAYEGCTFVVARRLAWRGDAGLEARQVSLVVASGAVLTFQEREDNLFDPVRARILQGGGQIRSLGTDYLLYALLDALVDDYLPVADQLGEALEALEERVIACPTRALVSGLSSLRGELLAMRRDVWPMREALHALLRGDAAEIGEPVRVYLRDVHDHCVQVAEILEVHRELAAGLQNLYLTSIANRTNEVMKVLTVVSTVFIPLTFLVGVWGMNFEHMPELAWPWAYPLVWAAMLAIAVGLWLFFRRRGWIGGRGEGS
jgi:magnesium transporter